MGHSDITEKKKNVKNKKLPSFSSSKGIFLCPLRVREGILHSPCPSFLSHVSGCAHAATHAHTLANTHRHSVLVNWNNLRTREGGGDLLAVVGFKQMGLKPSSCKYSIWLNVSNVTKLVCTSDTENALQTFIVSDPLGSCDEIAGVLKTAPHVGCLPSICLHVADTGLWRNCWVWAAALVQSQVPSSFLATNFLLLFRTV